MQALHHMYQQNRLESSLSTAGLAKFSQTTIFPMSTASTTATFFLMISTYNASADGQYPAAAWWVQQRTALSDDANMKKEFHHAGVHLHALLLPASDEGPVFVVWEIATGKTTRDLTEFVDKFVPGQGLGEKSCVVHPICTDLAAAIHLAVGFSPAFTSPPWAQPPPCQPEVITATGPSTYYVAQHRLPPVHRDQWWAAMQVATSADLRTSEETRLARGCYLHAAWPVVNRSGDLFSLWEVQHGRGSRELQDVLDNGNTKHHDNKIFALAASEPFGVHPHWCWPATKVQGQRAVVTME